MRQEGLAPTGYWLISINKRKKSMLRVQGTDKQKKGLHHRVYLAILLKLENKIALWITMAILCLNSSYIFELRQSGSQNLWLKLSLYICLNCGISCGVNIILKDMRIIISIKKGWTICLMSDCMQYVIIP